MVFKKLKLITSHVQLNVVFVLDLMLLHVQCLSQFIGLGLISNDLVIGRFQVVAMFSHRVQVSKCGVV